MAIQPREMKSIELNVIISQKIDKSSQLTTFEPKYKLGYLDENRNSQKDFIVRSRIAGIID